MNNILKQFPVIILAAGESQRMGKLKGLLDYMGKPFLSHQILCLKELGFSNIIVVLGKNYIQYREQIKELEDTKITINPNPEKGQFSSLLNGLSALSKKTQGVYILPLDVPCPIRSVWVQLAENLSLTHANVCIPEYEGKKGHPVLISEDFKQYLLTCKTNSRLDFEINKQKDMQKAKIISVKDKNITRNLNTPEEWEEFKVNP
jgi:molybdenum cofactor cytidylyltransferase